MSDSSASVLEKAQELAVQARTHSEGTKERDERARIRTALTEVERELATLASASESYAAARDAGVPLALLDPPEDLVNPSSGALPSWQALVVARKRTETMTKRATEAVREAWSDWAEAKLDATNPGRISRLGVAHRQRAADLQKRLRAATSPKELTARLITDFVRDLQKLEESLAGIREDDPVVVILDRIGRTSTSLADLTDEEVATLRRDASAAHQVILRTT